MGRPFGKKWTTIHRQTVRLYDAQKQDIKELRTFVKFLQEKIYNRVVNSKKCDKIGEQRWG